MSGLLDRLREIIRHDGPMPVSMFMLTCLHDPRHGYYATRPGLGRDFTTAPETSQVFGELLGAWAVHEWRAMGSPAPFWLVELGPGRGTMMSDMLRAAGKAPDFIEAMQLALIEASPMLRDQQSEMLAAFEPTHVRALGELPDGPAIILGNEFLDCMPVRQFAITGGEWRERLVGLGEDGSLRMGIGPAGPSLLDTDNAECLELAPELDTLVDLLGARFGRWPGRALFVDYGDDAAHPQDSLRAFRRGQQIDPLEAPGMCDLTADVDFLRLAALAADAGLSVAGPKRQGEFLLQLGAHERAEQLEAANSGRASEIRAGVERLVSAGEMGERFKAICLAEAGAPCPAGFDRGECA